MRIQHNIMAMNAYRNLSKNNSGLSKNLEKLSSGFRINRAGDDAAGLAISEKMRAQIAGLDQAQKNAQSGINLVQTAEGALTEVHDMLNRMVTLTSQAANGTYTEADRAKIQAEINSLTEEIDRIAENSNFNGTKLLDGSLEDGDLTEMGVTFGTVSTTNGVTVGESADGAGTKGTFTLDVTTLFGTDDTITFKGQQEGGGDLIAAAGHTLTFGATTSGTTFTGKTLEEQAQSIGTALGMNGEILTNFDISVEGTKVTLTAKAEGETGATITSAEVTDKTVDPGATTFNASAAAATGNQYDGAWQGLFGTDATSGTGVNVEVGDKLKFEFEGPNAETLSVTLEVTQDMLGTDGTVKTLTANVAKALQEASFDQDPDTAIDETKILVKDLFTIAGNTLADGTADDTANGSIYVQAKNSNAGSGLGNVTVTGDHIVTPKTIAPTDKTAGAGTSVAAGVTTMAAATNNFTDGDVVSLSGKLSDGSSFSIELKAGVDFEIGNDYDASVSNIVTALTDTASEAKVTLRDGTTIAANKIFSTGTTNEFKVENANSGDLKITSNKKGAAGTKGIAGSISTLEVFTADKATASFTPEAAVAQGKASSSVTLDKGIEYGAAIKVGDTIYEVVADARDTTSRDNTAVVIKDLANTSAEDIAKALETAVSDNLAKVKDADGNAMYSVSRDGATVTVETTDVGSDAKALEISTPYGDKVDTASFKLDSETVEEGAVMTINGQDYEFVKAGAAATKNGAIAVEIADFGKATSKDLADAFAKVAKGILVTGTAEDGTITVQSEAVDGVIAKPDISFQTGLTLQIGADAVETIDVSIDSMKAEDLGIKGLDVSDSKAANASLEKVKAAIEKVSVTRGNLGAIQNRLEHTINNLGVMEENIQDAEANIRDTDIADEMMAYTKNNILIQSAQAMLAQANQVPQGVLQLMG